MLCCVSPTNPPTCLTKNSLHAFIGTGVDKYTKYALDHIYSTGNKNVGVTKLHCLSQRD